MDRNLAHKISRVIEDKRNSVNNLIIAVFDIRRYRGIIDKLRQFGYRIHLTPDGNILNSVRYRSGGALTNSKVLISLRKSRRFLVTEHYFENKPLY